MSNLPQNILDRMTATRRNQAAKGATVVRPDGSLWSFSTQERALRFITKEGGRLATPEECPDFTN